MPRCVPWVATTVVLLFALAGLDARSVSPQSADSFSKKVAAIRQQGETPSRAPRRTPVTQDELNSWFTFRAQEYLPNGLSAPEATIIGNGQVAGQAVVDLDVIGKRRSSGGSLDPWNLLGGRVPVKVTGILHTRDGQARFEVQAAEISGLPVPTAFLQELVGYYSRSPERPNGVRLDDTFRLPAGIREIQVGQGQAIVVQ